MDVLSERVDQLKKEHDEHARCIAEHTHQIENLKLNQSDILKSFEKFQLKSDLLQERSNEMFRDIKTEMVKLSAQLDAFRTDQNAEHNIKPRIKAEETREKYIFFIVSTIVAFFLGVLLTNVMGG